ncbi:NPCBM/NEW2 domain protein [Pirellulimonas nuda]|uniref:NPCBM/NEW2 domain protein n=1 Tax=Pirellulimonas nuda TaxID=2528009 RepID=A0A518DB98_9BACT|nr:NPCBM/NEW2 domain-containing protein [Pirellulimonas nuda]QDU88738.1 NPCBM/NEW2 domain protein [Pirellulimonas nuda]
MKNVRLLAWLPILLCLAWTTTESPAAPESDELAPVRATLLDGTTLSGRTIRIDAEGLRMTWDGDVRQIGGAELEQIEFPDAVSASDQPAGWLELRDGSLAPVSDWAWDATGCSVVLASPLQVGSEPQGVEPGSVRAFRYRELNDQQSQQWRDLADRRDALDSIIIERGSGDLDRVEIVAVSASPESVRVLLDGEPIDVPRRKLVGLFLSGSTESEVAEETAVATGQHHLRLSLSSVRYGAKSGFSVVTRCGEAFALKSGGVARLDFRAGNVAYLSDLTPLRVDVKTYFAIDSEASELAARLAEPRWDRAYDGGPLRLLVDASDGFGKEQTFAKGVAARSRTTLVFARPEGFNHFAGLVGLDPSAPAIASALVSVSGDDEVLIEQALRSGEPAVPLRIDTQGFRQITIVIDFGENLDIGDRVVLADARFVR